MTSALTALFHRRSNLKKYPLIRKTRESPEQKFALYCPGGLCQGGSLSRVSLSRGSLSRGLCSGGLSPGGICTGGLCPRGSLSGESLSRVQGISVRETPCMVTGGQYGSYWNAFLFHRCEYRSGTVNSKSFVGKVLLRIKWKFELN